MSKENFIEYYEKWLRKPGNEAAAKKIDAITNEDEFAKAALEQGKTAGIKFADADVRAVMGASVAALKKTLTSKDKQLSDSDLRQVAGGSGPQLSSSVRIRSLGSISNINANLANLAGAAASTVMCCW